MKHFRPQPLWDMHMERWSNELNWLSPTAGFFVNVSSVVESGTASPILMSLQRRP